MDAPETIIVHDHGHPCEHGSLWPHWIDAANARWWKAPECLGGRTMMLRRVDERTWVEVDEVESPFADPSE